jgi:cell division protein FtsZ
LNAIKSALNSPLLNDNNINGARYVLLNITYGSSELTMDEINIITDYIQNEAGTNAEVIWGHGLDNSLGDNLNITLIATGFSVASTPVHGLEKPLEAKMIDLEEDSKVEISSPLSNPVSSFSSNNVSSLSSFSEPVSAPVQNYTPVESVISVTPEVEINESTVIHELIDVNEEIAPVVNETESEVNFEKNETYESKKEVEFDWEVTPVSQDESSPFVAETSVESSQAPVIQYELEDETDFVAPAPRSAMSPEEHQMKSQERVNRIKEYTTKLKMADGITAFETEPAYVRRNIQLSDESASTEKQVSKFGLSDDSDGNTHLRGNSFLHDNVD